MITCMILVGQIVLTTPQGAIILPPDAAVTIYPSIWSDTRTTIDMGMRELTVDVPVAEITTALATCGDAAK